MNRIARKTETPQKPRIEYRGETALWIVSHEEFASTWRVWKGDRTRVALELELKKERRAGRAAHLELETSACSPVALTLEELCALGIVNGEVRS